MKTTAIVVWHPPLPASSRSAARGPDFVALMKPRVMLLAVFTAVVGLMIASGHVDPLIGSIAILGIATGADVLMTNLNDKHDAAARADEYAHTALNAFRHRLLK